MSTETEYPLVSIIIPDFNHAHYVGDAIRSVLEQYYRNFEIIVVDDGSTDNSREVVEQFGEKVRYIYQENAGLSAARNTGIRTAKGTLIGVLDADDMYESMYLNTLVETLKYNPDADGVYCGYQFVDQENSLLPQIENRPVDSNELHEALLEGNFLVPESIFLRRYVYDYIGLFDESLRACEDWDVWLRVTKKYRIIHVPKILTRHRILAGSMSTDPSRMIMSRLAVLKKHIGNVPIENGSSKVHRAYGRAYLGSCVDYLQIGDQEHAYESFQKMVNVCPDLLTEVDTYYQLGCGDQPKGSMGDLGSLSVKRNSVPLLAMMKRLYDDSGTNNKVKGLERNSYAQVYQSLGLLAYNTREFREARRFFLRAITYNLRLIINKQLVSLWGKSLLNPKIVDRLKEIRQRKATI